jgi:hypothetical protein
MDAKVVPWAFVTNTLVQGQIRELETGDFGVWLTTRDGRRCRIDDWRPSEFETIRRKVDPQGTSFVGVVVCGVSAEALEAQQAESTVPSEAAPSASPDGR